MKSTTVRGTPINHVGPSGAFVGNKEGFTPGMPAGYSGKTVADQYRGDGVGIDTRPLPGSGTPYQDRDGNVDEARRVASQGRYGVSPDAGGIDMNDPAANGTGVVFDGTHRVENGNTPSAAPTLDSPVSGAAPVFNPGFMVEENREHLGKGGGASAPNEAMARDNLLEIGGVMSR